MSKVRKWKIAIVVALAVELATTIVPLQGALWTQHLITDLRQVQARIDALRLVQALVTDAESGQRGFVITGKDDFLVPYQAGLLQMQAAREHLREALGPENFAALSRLIDLKLDDMAAAIALRRLEGPERAQALVAGERGLLYMEGIRQLISEQVALSKSEQERLRAEFGRRSELTAWLGAAATTVEVLVLAWVLMLVFRLLDERARSEHRLREEANLDPLTGLYNRRYLEQQLAAELAAAGVHHRPLSLVLLDLDHFKLINDRHGHAVGDQVLQAVAGVLLAEVREGDMVARIGGEEMVLLMPGCSHANAVARAGMLCQRLRGVRLRETLLSIPVSASFGVATLPDHGGSARELMASADAAMYAAKEQGRDRVVSAAACVASV